MPPRSWGPDPLRTLLALALLALVVAPVAVAGGGTFAVPSTGETVWWTVGNGWWLITAFGAYTYEWGGDAADADHSYTSESGWIECSDWAANLHDLLVNDVSPWTGPCVPGAAGVYSVLATCDGSCPVRFRIYDDYYPDNDGVINVDIQPYTSTDPGDLPILRLDDMR